MNDKTLQSLIRTARALGRGALNEPEGKVVLQSFGIAVPASRVLDDAAEIEAAVAALAPPFVLKVVSDQVLHKSDFGGVALRLADADAVRAAMQRMQGELAARGIEGSRWLLEEMATPGVEVVVGAVTDPEFGPMVMVGLGGIFVEVLKDVAFRICPIERADALEMIESLRGLDLLRGARGAQPASLEAIVDVLLRIGGDKGLMMQAAADITEVDLNPLIVTPESATAVDARFILRQ